MRVVSVNVGKPQDVTFRIAGRSGRTGIEKHPVGGPVRITFAGVAGNEVSDKRNHGDEHMRVYAYAGEDYAWWSAELGADLTPGHFGEQLTTEGIDLNAALVGETWRVGTALLRIAHVRTPCLTFQGWMGHTGYDARQWIKRFTLAGRPGPYFRVIEEGVVEAGSPIEVVDRPDHDVSVATLFGAVMHRPELLPRLLAVPDLKPWVRERAEQATAT